MEDSHSVPVGEALIHPQDGSGEICQVDSTCQWDIESADSLFNEDYAPSQSEGANPTMTSEERHAAGKEITPSQALPENLPTSELPKTKPRGRIKRWWRKIILWKK